MSEFDESKAKQRFMLLNLVRIAGIALVLGGVVIAEKGEASSAPIFGMLLAVAGLGSFFFWPRRLASRWKSKDE